MKTNQQQEINDKTIEFSDILYLINEEKKTASVFKGQKAKGEVIIPSTITFESQDYPIISILSDAFRESNHIKSIQFAEGSKLQTINNYAFISSSIERCTIPPHLNQIGESAFCHCLQLTTIEILSNSELKRICKYAFSESSIESFTIPPHLTEICENAFSQCKSLSTFEIPENSELRTIGNSSFSNSSIENFTIPPHLTEIGDFSFRSCHNLQAVKAMKNSELQFIGRSAFSNSSIEWFKFPSSLIELGDEWCKNTPNLNKIEISPKNPRYSLHEEKMVVGKLTVKSRKFDLLVFCCRDVVIGSIPKSIIIIGPFSFDHCKHLRSIEFEKNSELQVIDRCAFSSSSIEKVVMPIHLKRICEYAFESCCNVKRIDFPENSELEVIDKYAFTGCSIRSLKTPPRLKRTVLALSIIVIKFKLSKLM